MTGGYVRRATSAERHLGATLGLTSAAALENLRAMQHAAGGDPYGVRTIEGAKAAYVRGDIELDEFEVRVGELLRGRVIGPRPAAKPKPGQTYPQRYWQSVRAQWERLGVPPQLHAPLMGAGVFSWFAMVLDLTT